MVEKDETQNPDKALALALQNEAAQPEAFATLYETYVYSVFNYCLFRVNDRAVAEDLTADTFERAWKARHKYQPERAAFQTWLFVIARNIVTDWQRRQTRHPLLRLSFKLPTHIPLLEKQIEDSEEQAQLRRLIQNLNPPDRELIALKFGVGMTNREVAVIVGKKESAVGSALHRLMQRLRSEWKKNG